MKCEVCQAEVDFMGFVVPDTVICRDCEDRVKNV